MSAVEEPSGRSAPPPTAVRDRVDILIIDKEGELRGRFSGWGQLDAAQQLINQLRQSTASL